jgi:hypothetical protein
MCAAFPAHLILFNLITDGCLRAELVLFAAIDCFALTRLKSESQLLYDWRCTANQFVLATSPLRLATINFVFQQNTCCYSPYVSYEYAWPLSSVCITDIACYCKILSFCTICKFSVSPGFAKQIMPILRILCYKQISLLAHSRSISSGRTA